MRCRYADQPVVCNACVAATMWWNCSCPSPTTPQPRRRLRPEGRRAPHSFAQARRPLKAGYRHCQCRHSHLPDPLLASRADPGAFSPCSDRRRRHTPCNRGVYRRRRPFPRRRPGACRKRHGYTADRRSTPHRRSICRLCACRRISHMQVWSFQLASGSQHSRWESVPATHLSGIAPVTWQATHTSYSQ